MRAPSKFLTRIMAGYAVVIALLGVAILVLVSRMNGLALSQMAEVRQQEREQTIVERLRWHSELLVSVGRGYLISGEPAFLGRLQEVEGDVRGGIRELRQAHLGPAGLALLHDVEAAEARYLYEQEKLLLARGTDDQRELVRRFEQDLLPHTRRLFDDLDRLSSHKDAAILEVYARSEQERGRLQLWLYGVLASSLALTLAIAWGFSRTLAATYAKERRAVEAAQRAVASRDRLMGMVAHDLRNPLSSIKMGANLLARRLEPAGPLRRNAETIERVADRMSGLVGNMLDMATLEAGRFTVAPEPCPVEELLRESVETFAGLATSRQVELACPSPPPGLSVLADRDRVQQVFSNLIGNALKFTPKDGRITLAAEPIGTTVRFRVSDTGPGIPAEDLPHVFDLFWKHEREGRKGTGLGLFIARGIVDAHGGRLWIESPPGEGATFYFTLQQAPRLAEPASSTAVPRPRAEA